ncbi:MAG TPA: hypothetical protein IAA58_12460 [Candidatus Gallacutalibacter stercoravium]|nr:hypothetical protein [Candidatus Gallacutalibacter stercoravium]
MQTKADNQAEIERVIEVFHRKKPINYTLQEIRQEESDSRWVLFVSFAKERFVIKIAANGFTTQQRVEGWNTLIAAYTEMGYYSPKLLKSLTGHFSERITFQNKQCVVWEEEFCPYHLQNSLDERLYRNADGSYSYQNDVFAFVGKVAQKHFDNFPYPSGWVRFEPYGSDEICDEVTDCVHTFDRLVRTKAPRFIPRWESILGLFRENSARLQKIYHNLPTSVFQADACGGNLVLDENGRFMGVIDYNLAGKDTALNMFLSMILFEYSRHRKQAQDPGVLPGLNKETQDSVIAIMLQILRDIKKYYRFHELEAAAAPLLYKYIDTVTYEAIDTLETYADEEEKLHLLFDFMEYQLTNDTIDFKAAMLGENGPGRDFPV